MLSAAVSERHQALIRVPRARLRVHGYPFVKRFDHVGDTAGYAARVCVSSRDATRAEVFTCGHFGRLSVAFRNPRGPIVPESMNNGAAVERPRNHFGRR
jgi:hypothetical protein